MAKLNPASMTPEEATRAYKAAKAYASGRLDLSVFVYDPRRRMPLSRGLAFHAASRDEYLRDSLCDCADCGKQFRLRDSESADLCTPCFDAAGEENARLDGN